MKVRLLRKGSQGIKGTYANIDHHAQSLKPLVQFLESEIKYCGFKEWAQGHNVHLFVTHDERRFTMRGVKGEAGEGYIGITLYCRQSRQNEIPLATLYCDTPSTSAKHRFASMLGFLAEIPPHNHPKGDE